MTYIHAKTSYMKRIEQQAKCLLLFSREVEISLPVLTTRVCGSWDSNTQPSAFEVNAQTDCATAAGQFTVTLVYSNHAYKEMMIITCTKHL